PNCLSRRTGRRYSDRRHSANSRDSAAFAASTNTAHPGQPRGSRDAAAVYDAELRAAAGLLPIGRWTCTDTVLSNSDSGPEHERGAVMRAYWMPVLYASLSLVVWSAPLIAI